MILLVAALLQTTSGEPPSIARPDGSVAASAADDCPRLVFFDSGKAELNRDAAAELDRVAARIRGLGEARIELTGYSDRSGPAKANLRISRERAELVRSALVERGVRRDLISITALGETRSLIDTADGVREPQNRRVEIRFSRR